MDDERWQPDTAMVLTLRTRKLPISQLSGPDRAWIVASLTVDGWTVANIAERLDCSLRLIQQIKAEPMTRLALWAIDLQRQLAGEQSLRRLEAYATSAALAEAEKRISRLTHQRDALLTQCTRLQARTQK